MSNISLDNFSWAPTRVWIILVRVRRWPDAAVNCPGSDHWWPWAPAHIMQTTAAGWSLQTFTADQMRNVITVMTVRLRYGDRICVNSGDPLEESATVGPGHCRQCPAVVATLPVRDTGDHWPEPAYWAKSNTNIIDLSSCRNIEHFALFVAVQLSDKDVAAVKIDLLKLDCQSSQREGATQLPPGVKKPEQSVQNTEWEEVKSTRDNNICVLVS